MADQKISELTDGGSLAAGDEIPVVRSGSNFKVTAGVTPVARGGTGVTTTAAAKDVYGFLTDVVDDTTPQLGGALDGNQKAIDTFLNTINVITTAAYTFVSADTGKVHAFQTAGTAVATIPGVLPVGWSADVYQASAGELQFVASEGGTLKNRQGHTKCAGSAAAVNLTVLENSGSAAAIFMVGDTA